MKKIHNNNNKYFVLTILLILFGVFLIGCNGGPAPIDSPIIDFFIVDVNTIEEGESATLGWQVTDADSVTISHGIGEVNSSGSYTVSPTETITYILTATNSAGSVTDTAMITVNPADEEADSTIPTIHSFTSDYTWISPGGSVNLSWEVSNADTVTIEPVFGEVNISGLASVSPSTTTTYTLTASNSVGDNTAEITIMVLWQPPDWWNGITILPPNIESFSADKSFLTEGITATLSWEVSGIATVTIEPGIGEVENSGTHNISPTETTTYTLTAGNVEGSNVETVTIVVEPVKIIQPGPADGKDTWVGTFKKDENYGSNEHVVYEKFGYWTDLLGILGFFDVFHSPGFIITTVLLLLNIMVCTLSRLGRLKEELLPIEPFKSRDFYRQGSYKAEKPRIRLTSETTVSSIEKILKQYHYHWHKKEKEGVIYFAAEKHRYSIGGTYVLHLSILLFVAAFILTGFFGFKDSSFVITEDTVREIGHSTGLSLYLESFTDYYWPDGTPKGYSSKVKVLKNGSEVKEGIISVNHPLYYEGIRFHQLSYGPAVRIKVSGSKGRLLLEDSLPLPEYRDTDTYRRPQGKITLEGTPYFVVILASAVNKKDPSIGEQEIGLELYGIDNTPLAWAKLAKDKTQQIKGMGFTLIDQLNYSGLQISRDPGVLWIWIASLMFIAGLVLVFYFPRRRIWACVYPVLPVSSGLLIRMIPMKAFGAQVEFSKIIANLAERFNPRKENQNES